MDGFVLFWRAVFGLRPEQLWELPDPHGLVRSRAMIGADGAVRLALNVSESRQTATGRFVSAIAGAGVHHVAFATAAAAAAVEAAAARAAPLLRIPENYYDDLAACFRLDADRLAALRRLNLLYDRDQATPAAAAEFVHAYTDTFADRFFFEIAERRGGYRLYGAANAAVRMAAQARGTPRRSGATAPARET
jgi:4-hydroxyphenylpyruvate dioxygenase